MKSYREELWFQTKTRRAFLNITPQVEEALRKSGVREGLVLGLLAHPGLERLDVPILELQQISLGVLPDSRTLLSIYSKPGPESSAAFVNNCDSDSGGRWRPL